eukprot:g392.t1
MNFLAPVLVAFYAFASAALQQEKTPRDSIGLRHYLGLWSKLEDNDRGRQSELTSEEDDRARRRRISSETDMYPHSYRQYAEGTGFRSKPVNQNDQQTIPAGSFGKIFSIWFENHGYQTTKSNSYWAKIMKKSYVFKHHYGVYYPSQPNYIAVLGGTYEYCNNDDRCYLNNPNVIDQLEEHGYSWKGYMEGYKANYDGSCNTADKIQGYDSMGHYHKYVRKHNPFMAWETITEDDDRCANVVSSVQFQDDVKNNQLPHYGFYTPDLDNDSHDQDLDYSGQYLQDWLDNYFYAYPDTWKNVLLFVFFQADDGSEGNNIPAFVLTAADHSYLRPQDAGTDATLNPNGIKTNHYSFLKLVQDNFGLGRLSEWTDGTYYTTPHDTNANAMFLPIHDYNAPLDKKKGANAVGKVVVPVLLGLAGAICLIRCCFKCGCFRSSAAIKGKAFCYPGYPTSVTDGSCSALSYEDEAMASQTSSITSECYSNGRQDGQSPSFPNAGSRSGVAVATSYSNQNYPRSVADDSYSDSSACSESQYEPLQGEYRVN